ncbi:MAG: type II toxin-antitoxin system RelE/ParE family toxin [Pedosphaera sp.]|nr:type II toxin-antitoxin system RelE/ParE family toxin [Pedosphaera sp.]
MENFSIQWRNSTKKDIRGLPNQEVARIIAAVTLLAFDPLPHGSQKLSGSERTYRIRVGDYRVVYEVFTDSRLVEIQRVRHRKDVYR